MSSSPRPTKPVVRASEIGQWLYCQRAWWLDRQGYTNQNQDELAEGTLQHEQHAQNVAQAYILRQIAIYLLILGLLILIAVWLAHQLTLL